MSPVFSGGTSEFFPKQLGKIAGRRETAGNTDVCDRMAGINQVLTGLLQTDIEQIFKRRGMQLGLKGTVTFSAAAHTGSGDFIECNFFDKMFIQIRDHQFDTAG